MRRLLLALLLLTTLMPAAYAQKTTIDPNTAEAKSKLESPDSFWTTDKQLSQKVTYEARRNTILSILTDINELSGVKLKAGYNSNDWQVRDRKMNIFVKDIPLSDLMQSIARTMKFKWDRSERDGVYKYRLYMDRRTLLEAEGQAYRAEEKYNQEQKKKREAFADKLNDLDNASSEDLAKLRETSPMLHAISSSGMGSSLKQIFDGVPGFRDAFINSKEMRLNFSDMSQSMQKAMLGIAQGIARMSPDSDISADRLGANPEILSEVSLQHSRDNASQVDNILSRFELGEIDFIYKRISADGSDMGSSELGFPIFDPDCGWSKAMGKAMIQLMECPDAEKNLSISCKIDPDELAKFDFGEPQVKHIHDEQELKNELDYDKITKDKKIEHLDDLLSILTQQTDFNVVSDSLDNATPPALSGKIPAIGVFDCISMVNSYNWWQHGSIIEMRDRYWFKKRALQIPEMWLEKWRDTFKTTGTLGVGDLSDMAVLLTKKGQYEFNIKGDQILDNYSVKSALDISRAFLEFYNTLNSYQRAALNADSGLDLAALSSEQRQSAKKCIYWWNGTSEYIIKCSSRKDGDFTLYDYTGSDGNRVSWIRTPKYVALKDDPQSSGQSHPIAR